MTVAVEAMTFIAPVKVGDILCVYTSVERVGNTSITIAHGGLGAPQPAR